MKKVLPLPAVDSTRMSLKNRHLETVRVLLDLGADVNRADSSRGAAPLHYAVRQYHTPEVIALLLARGADPTLRTRRGNTPGDLALRMGRWDVAAQLGAAPGGEGAPAAQPRGDGISLRPFLGIEGSLEESAGFYQNLGFHCDRLEPDDNFAALSLGEARFMMGGGSTREQVQADEIVYRCSADAFSRLVAAVGRRGIRHALTADGLTTADPTGYQLRFLPEAGGAVLVEPSLGVSDLQRSLAFYRALGFEPLEAAPTTSGATTTVHLHSARIQLRQHRASAGRQRALGLWLTCEDFDGTYHSNRLEDARRSPRGHLLRIHRPPGGLSGWSPAVVRRHGGGHVALPEGSSYQPRRLQSGPVRPPVTQRTITGGVTLPCRNRL